MINCVKVNIKCDIPGCKTAWDVMNKPNVYSFSRLPIPERGIRICSNCLREIISVFNEFEPDLKSNTTDKSKSKPKKR